MKAYVTFFEAAGARVIPLIVGEPHEVTTEKLKKLNGVFLPGGDGDYFAFGRTVMDLVINYNDHGLFYPVFGVCMGFENMMGYAADAGQQIIGSYILHNVSLPLEFVVEPSTSKLWTALGDDYIKFEQNSMTFNSHDHGVDPESFTNDKGLAQMYRLLTVSYDPNDGRTFTSSVEAFDYPFVGLQFHPEKTMAMFNDNIGIDHSWQSIVSNRYFADRFMQWARQNTNRWGDFATVQEAIISNCKMIVTDQYQGEVYAFSSEKGCIP